MCPPGASDLNLKACSGTPASSTGLVASAAREKNGDVKCVPSAAPSVWFNSTACWGLLGRCTSDAHRAPDKHIQADRRDHSTQPRHTKTQTQAERGAQRLECRLKRVECGACALCDCVCAWTDSAKRSEMPSTVPRITKNGLTSKLKGSPPFAFTQLFQTKVWLLNLNQIADAAVILTQTETVTCEDKSSGHFAPLLYVESKRCLRIQFHASLADSQNLVV